MTTTTSLDPLKVFIKTFEGYPLLTHKQELELGRRIQEGDAEAKKILINSNLRLVVKFARQYQNGTVSIHDLIQEGAIGLQRAAEKFDPARGLKFSTYAVPWIKQAVNRANMRYGRNIRIPFGKIQELRRQREQVSSLASKLGREPEVFEVASLLGISEDEVIENNQLMCQIASLDDTMKNSDSDGTTFGEMIQEVAPSVEEEIENIDRNRVLLEVMRDVLTEREKKILCMRYGIGYKEPQSLEDIGKEFGVTRERVRQIEVASLEKLKSSGQILR